MTTRSADFNRLIDALLTLRQPLDDAGETFLTPDEAARIRMCGVDARAGRWYCPKLPRCLVGGIWRLSFLSEDIPAYERPVPWREKRAAVLHQGPVDPLGKFDHRLIRLLQRAPGGSMTRAVKRTLWRPGARFVDFTINRLLDLDQIAERDGRLYPCSRRALADRLEADSRPRRPVPVTTS